MSPSDDELIARLRAVDASWSQVGEDCAAAAARIEALERERDEALDHARYIAQHGDMVADDLRNAEAALATARADALREAAKLFRAVMEERMLILSGDIDDIEAAILALITEKPHDRA